MGPNSGYYEDIYWWGTGSEEKTESNLIKSSKLLVGDYFGCSSHLHELLVLLLVKQFIRKCGFWWRKKHKTFNQALLVHLTECRTIQENPEVKVSTGKLLAFMAKMGISYV